LRVDQVLEVVDEFDVLNVPGSHRSVLGVTPIRHRLVPLVRLASLITGSEPPETRGDAAVLARCLGSLVAFEVDDVEELVMEAPRPAPEAWRLPWAAGVIRHEGQLMPIVDLDVLAERLISGELEKQHGRG
jgi:chemotaxis signal transduction protein